MWLREAKPYGAVQFSYMGNTFFKIITTKRLVCNLHIVALFTLRSRSIWMVSRLFGLGALFIFSIGCTSYKKLIYFQDLDRTKISKEEIDNYSPLVIQTEDILGISITSLNPEASAVFSFSSQSSGAGGGAEYLVDHSGQINLPLIGNLPVAGMTTSQLREDVRKRLLIYLKEPIVNIRLINFKVSVIGDVSNPGVYNVDNEKITIPELLSMAGDMNNSAKRNEVLIIREQDGKREYIPVDLTKNVFRSPYLYLKNNDLIYVQQDKNTWGGISQTTTLIASLVSLGVIIFQIFQ
jgi:polysaccharide export outer membrane protein